MKKLLSFDQAANITGWSYWEDKKPKEWGIITPIPKSLKDGARLSSLRKQFKALIEKYNPNIVLIENPVGGEEDKQKGPENNWQTMQTLCQVQGVLIQVIDELHKQIEIISPSSWQFTCNIHARDRDARKNGARKFVQYKYNLTEAEVAQDICDSLCIAFHYLEGGVIEECAF